MGFEADRGDGKINVGIPCYRTDIMHQMDLVEEIAIAYGYENFKPVMPKTFGIGKENPLNSRYMYVKDLLAGFGLIEVHNWLLTNQDVLFKKFVRQKKRVVETLYPQSEELTLCRDVLAPQLIEFLGKNKHNDYPQNIFEVGEVLNYDSKEVKQETHLGIVLAHSKSNYSELKAVIDVLFKELGVDVKIKNDSKQFFIPGRAADLIFDGKVVGFIGEVHPKVLANYDLRVPVTVCELNVEELVKD
jgi:phenylalanyl-tRNA synthetase beta chain